MIWCRVYATSEINDHALNQQVDYDWCELENVLFIQDFPLLKDGPAANENTLPDFGKDIYEQLSLMGVPMAVKKEILLYDFSKAKVYIGVCGLL
jgi:hypothetical protein